MKVTRAASIPLVTHDPYFQSGHPVTIYMIRILFTGLVSASIFEDI